MDFLTAGKKHKIRITFTTPSNSYNGEIIELVTDIVVVVVAHPSLSKMALMLP